MKPPLRLIGGTMALAKKGPAKEPEALSGEKPKRTVQVYEDLADALVYIVEGRGRAGERRQDGGRFTVADVAEEYFFQLRAEIQKEIDRLPRPAVPKVPRM